MNRLHSVLLAAVLAASCVAQRADPFDSEVANVLILQARTVQKELGVTEGQRAKLQAYAEVFSKKKDAFLTKERARSQKEGKSFKPNERGLRDLFTVFREQVLSQLSAKQTKRLRELTLQEVGMASMLDNHVAQRLGISSAQTSKLRAAYEEGLSKTANLEQQAVLPIRNEFQGKDPNDKKTRELFNKRMAAAEKQVRPKLEAIKVSTRAKFNAILTAQQKAQWKALLGTPFNG